MHPLQSLHGHVTLHNSQQARNSGNDAKQNAKLPAKDSCVNKDHESCAEEAQTDDFHSPSEGDCTQSSAGGTSPSDCGDKTVAVFGKISPAHFEVGQSAVEQNVAALQFLTCEPSTIIF